LPALILGAALLPLKHWPINEQVPAFSLASPEGL